MPKLIESFCLVILTALVILAVADLLGWIHIMPTARFTVTAAPGVQASGDQLYISICSPNAGCVDITVH